LLLLSDLLFLDLDLVVEAADEDSFLDFDFDLAIGAVLSF
jgi:hypothetical protein